MPCKYFHCKWLVRKRNARKKTHKKTQNTKTQKKNTTKCTLSFYWNIFHLQCWVSFRCATKLFKYAYIYICKYGASQVAQWENKSTCQCRRGKFDPWVVGRFPGGRNGNPLQYSCLENPTGGRAQWVTSTGLQIVRRNWACICVNMYSFSDFFPLSSTGE